MPISKYSREMQVIMFVGAYLGITLIVLLIRSHLDWKELGWISGTDGRWNVFKEYYTPRLKPWALGVMGIGFWTFILSNNGTTILGMLGEFATYYIGVFVMIPMILFGIAAFMMVLCIMFPFIGCVQQHHELD